MRPILRNGLWLLFAAGCGFLGYRHGVGTGADVMAYMSMDLNSAEAINGLESSMAMLDEQDSATLRKRHEQYFRHSLLELGNAGHGMEYRRCHPRQQTIVAKAAVFLAANPEAASKSDPLVTEALKFCDPT